MTEEIMRSYSNNSTLLVLSAFTFLIGYIEYIYSFRLVLREKRGPFPLWMHTFYFAHDLTGAIVFFRLAQSHRYFWFFTMSSIALLVWNGFEIFNLFMAVKVEREDIWGRTSNGPVSVRAAILNILGQIIMMAVVVNLLRVFMSDAVMFKWFA